jgi:hypothetical protein
LYSKLQVRAEADTSQIGNFGILTANG